MLIFHRKPRILHSIPKKLDKLNDRVPERLDDLEVKQMSLFDTVK